MLSRNILIEDSKGNKNLWIIDGFDSENYTIRSRGVIRYLKIKDTYKTNGKLHTKVKIDIGETNIELKETWKPYINKMCWMCGNCDRQNDYCKVKGIRSSSVKGNVCYCNTNDEYRDIDLGYMEDDIENDTL
jgi:hypothetical protein